MIRDFYDIDLSGRNSFHVRQRAARLVEFETTDDLTAFSGRGRPRNGRCWRGATTFSSRRISTVCY